MVINPNVENASIYNRNFHQTCKNLANDPIPFPELSVRSFFSCVTNVSLLINRKTRLRKLYY